MPELFSEPDPAVYTFDSMPVRINLTTTVEMTQRYADAILQRVQATPNGFLIFDPVGEPVAFHSHVELSGATDFELSTRAPVTDAERRRRAEWTAAAEERNRVRQAAHAERERVLALARDKAAETLHRMLTPQQRKRLDKHGSFLVTGNLGTTYEVDNSSYSGNIDWIDAGSRRANFCCHPSMTGMSLQGERERLPLADALIAQKLMLETDELGFLRTAVKNRGEWPPVADVHATRLPHEQRCICKSCRSVEGWAW